MSFLSIPTNRAKQMTDTATEMFSAITRVESIPDAYVVPFYLSDRKLRISIARVEGRVYAFDDLCTCARPACPLSGGLLIGTTILCQCHGSRYDIRTGAVVEGPASQALNVYETRVVEANIEVQLR